MTVTLCIAVLVAAASVVGAKTIPLRSERVDPTTLLFLSNGQLYRMNIDTSVDVQPNMTLFMNDTDVVDYDFDTDRDTLFWLNQHGQVFARRIFNQSDYMFVFQSEMASSEAHIRYDFVTKKFYEIDAELMRLDVVDAGYDKKKTLIDKWPGTMHITLLNGTKEFIREKPVNFVLDPLTRLVFITTNFGPNKQIYRVDMDGIIKKCIVSDCEDVLAIDTDKRRIYWTNKHMIESSNYNGDERVSVASFHDAVLVSLAVYNDYLYWVFDEHDSIKSSSKWFLAFCKLVEDKCEKSTIHQIQLNLPIHSMKILRPSSASRKFTNPCIWPGNGGCKHICLLSNKLDGKKCMCNNGWQLMDDEKSCRPNDKNLGSDKMQRLPANGRSKRQVTWDMYSQQPTLRPDPQLPQQPSHIPIYIFYPGK